MTLVLPHPSLWFGRADGPEDASALPAASRSALHAAQAAAQAVAQATEAEALLAAIRRDDPHALETLYRQYYERLVRYVYQTTHDDDLSRSLVQDVFVAVWERRTSLSVKHSLDSYLYRAVRNRALKAVRDTRRRQALSQSAAHEAQTSPGMGTPAASDVLAQLQAGELDTLIARAVAALPARQHEALALRWSHALSYADAAIIMQVSEARVRQLVMRAEEQVRAVVLPYVRDE
jgi:RNA polymerase sigma-70 factor (ECF subfamily)